MGKLNFVLGSLMLLLIGFTVGLYIGKTDFVGKPIQEIPAGTIIKAYNIQEAFDRKTGEPVYWIIGDTITWEKIYGNVVPVHGGEIFFCEIPRQRIERIENLSVHTNPFLDIELRVR